jgi:phosphoadenosine phosphosulfate reductase
MNLFGDTPESEAIRLLQEFEPEEGYWGAFSGGKDSVCLKEVARRSGVKVDWHYNVTTIDPPELVRFIKEQHPDVSFEKPPRSFYAYIRANKGLPCRTSRWCCEELKERGGKGRTVITGIRAHESRARMERASVAGGGQVQHCLRGGNQVLVHPLISWSYNDVWTYIRSNGLPYCSLYDEGFKRLGCVFCPFERDMERARTRWPKMFARLEAAVRDAYPTQGGWQKHGSPEAVLEWWLSRDDRRNADDPAQQAFAWDQFDGDGDAT